MLRAPVLTGRPAAPWTSAERAAGMTTCSTASLAPGGRGLWTELRGTSDGVLQALGGEGLDHLAGWLCCHPHLLAKHHLRPGLPCGLVLQLQHHQLRDGELLRLRDLRVGNLPQLG